MIDIWSYRAPDEAESKGIYLEVGQPVDLRVEFYNRGGAPEVELKWIEPATEERKGNPAEELLVYVGGLTHGMARESHDLMDLSLPADQTAEIKELAATYPHMLVVLNGGTVMELSEISALVPSILLQWFPGQEGGYALADIITGAYNPAGRLPVTFYTDSDKLLDFEDYEIRKGRTYMYAKDNVTYPFGYGLSYTTFEYSKLKVAQNKTQIGAVVNVTNSGSMDGDEVVQLYVSNQNSKVKQPIRQLKAFKRVTVPKGTTVRVELSFKKEDLAWWDENKQQYVVDPGWYKIQVGKSAGEICAEQMIKLR